MVDLIKKTQAQGVIFISGDMHWAEFGRQTNDVPYPFWELTSSGLTQEWKDVSPNKYRWGRYTPLANYGVIEINWETPGPQVTLSIKNKMGVLQLQNTLGVSELHF